MNSLIHIKEKAIEFRKQGFTLPEICDRLKKSRGTIYYWIKNVKIKKTNIFIKKCRENISKAAIKAGQASRLRSIKIKKEIKQETLKNAYKKFKNIF